MSDFRLAIRALRATPVITSVALLSLALGIGANTAVFSLVNRLLLHALPVADPERLATISSDDAVKMGFNAGIGWNYPMFDALWQRRQAFDGVAAWTVQPLDLSPGGQTQPVQALITNGEFFSTLGLHAAIGRLYSAADDVRGGGAEGPVVVLSHAFWQHHFGGAASAIGTSLPIGRVPFRVVGVAPQAFAGLEVGRSFDIALPLGAETLVRGGHGLVDEPRNLILFTLVRLKPGQTIAAATARLRAMQGEMHGALQVPRFAKDPFTLVPAGAGVDLPSSARPTYQRPLLAVFVIAGLVLLIACGNIANLLLARATARRHEISLRMALGAPRWRLARQFLLESAVLSTAGAAVGMALGAWASRALAAQLAVDIDTSFDWRVLAFTAAVAALTTLLFGTGAALRSMRVAPIDALKEQGRSAGAGRGRGVSSGLVVAQVALSLVLVTAAGLFLRSFTRLSSVPLGFDKAHVLLARVDLSRTQIPPPSRAAFSQRLAHTVAAVSGVTSAAASSSSPIDMGLPGDVTVPGAPAGTRSERIVVSNGITPGWFATYGTALRSGRDFDERDSATGQPVVIINDAFARTFFPGRNPIGELVSGKTIVGVVADQVLQGGFHADGRTRSIRDAAPPTMYTALAQSAGPGRPTLTVSVRTSGDPVAVVRGIDAALTSADPDLAFSIVPLASAMDSAIARERLVAALSGFFGVLAILLAGLGLYGITSYATHQQRAEIAIRLALGAAPMSVLRLVLSRVAVLIGVGIVAGTAVSVWAASFVASLLFGLTPRDPVALVTAVVMLVAVGVFAGGVPALRAARTDPAATLRNEA